MTSNRAWGTIKINSKHAKYTRGTLFGNKIKTRAALKALAQPVEDAKILTCPWKKTLAIGERALLLFVLLFIIEC